MQLLEERKSAQRSAAGKSLIYCHDQNEEGESPSPVRLEGSPAYRFLREVAPNSLQREDEFIDEP